MIKLAYITRVSIPNKVAQAAQITSMCKSFHDTMGEDFILISPVKEMAPIDDISFNRKIIYVKTKRKILRNIIFATKVAFFLRKGKVENIYTRDVLIAVIATVIFKIPTCYEAHQPMRSYPSKLLQSIVARNEFFKLVTITKSLKDYYGKLIDIENKDHQTTKMVSY